VSALVNDGTATAGMVAKLRACEHAMAAGVDDVVIVDGREAEVLAAAAINDAPRSATWIVAERNSAPGTVRCGTV